MSMTTRAAVCRAPGQPWEITELELDEPKANEIRIKFYAAGLCHSDDHIQKGDAPMRMPVVGGHEGAGVVDAIGAGVTRVAVGDHVTCSFIPACGSCRYCSTGRQNLCDAGKNAGTGMFPDGTFRFHANGEDFGGLCVLGTFSQYAVVSEFSVIRIPEDIPFDVAALVACGVPTGWGSAVRAGGVRAGETVVIYGAGGVGSNAVQGASLAGAKNVIVVNPVEFKREMAGVFGATHTFATAKEAHEFVVETTWGELADHAIITVGILHDQVIHDAIQVVGKSGQVTITAVGNGWIDREPRHADRLPAPDTGLHLRRLQPAVRCPAPDRPLPVRRPQAGRTDHPPVPARGSQPGLPGHAGRQEHPRRHHPRALTPARTQEAQ